MDTKDKYAGVGAHGLTPIVGDRKAMMAEFAKAKPKPRTVDYLAGVEPADYPPGWTEKMKPRRPPGRRRR